jgi:3-deoxy-D-manno-octulosonic-acid transferase
VINIYYLLVALILALAGPFMLLVRKARAGVLQKLGVLPDSLKQSARGYQNGIWIHAVSVGEFNAVKPLIERIRDELPQFPIVVSTTTHTGQALARDKVGDYAQVLYFPFDLPFATGFHLSLFKPRLVVVAETELWPGFVNECTRRGIPIIVVNGRMSPKSFRFYRRFKLLFGPTLGKLAHLVVQSDNEAGRYREVGDQHLPITVSGNMKLDGLVTIGDTEINDLRDRIGLHPGDFVVIAGSTHEGEEAAVLAAHKQTLENFRLRRGYPLPRPRLIIAPRHPERFERVVKLVCDCGFTPRRFSSADRFDSDQDVFVLDGLGQLAGFYGLASIAFVGGSLVPVGGHSLVEPLAYSVATICGPHVHKTRDIANALLEAGALVMVGNSEELKERIVSFHNDPQRSQVELGLRGQRWIGSNQGAVERTFTVVRDILLRESRQLSYMASAGGNGERHESTSAPPTLYGGNG